MKSITRDEAIQRLITHKREKAMTVFTVVFIKRTTGEERVMNARFGVKRHLAGGPRAYDPSSHGLIWCYDMQAEPGKGYRSIAAESIKELRIDGETLIVMEDKPAAIEPLT